MIVRSAVGATLTKAPKLSQPEQVQSPVPGKTKKTRKPTQKKNAVKESRISLVISLIKHLNGGKRQLWNIH